MGKLTDDMTRLVGEIRACDEHRADFIKGVQNRVKQCAEETRGVIANFRNDIDGAHSAFGGRKTAHHKGRIVKESQYCHKGTKTQRKT